MGALEAPQDRHGQEHRTGTSRAELGAQEAMAELGAQEAMAVQGAQEALASVPSARPLQPEPLLPPPPPNFPGVVRGYQEPSGAKQTGQYKTGKPSGARQTGQDSPQEQEALLGELGS